MRTLLLTFAIFLLPFALHGCGREGETVVLYTSVDQPVAAPIIRDFEQKTGIHVKVEVVPWSDLLNRLLAAATSGRGPDVVNIGNTWSASLQATNALIAFDATGDPLALFTTLALLSTFVYVFGYVLSVAAELCHSLARRTRGGPPGGTLAIAAIALAMVFSVWMAGATGAEAVQRGTVLILIGIPVYVVTRRTNPSGRLVAGAPAATSRGER